MYAENSRKARRSVCGKGRQNVQNDVVERIRQKEEETEEKIRLAALEEEDRQKRAAAEHELRIRKAGENTAEAMKARIRKAEENAAKAEADALEAAHREAGALRKQAETYMDDAVALVVQAILRRV